MSHTNEELKHSACHDTRVVTCTQPCNVSAVKMHTPVPSVRYVVFLCATQVLARQSGVTCREACRLCSTRAKVTWDHTPSHCCSDSYPGANISHGHAHEHLVAFAVITSRIWSHPTPAPAPRTKPMWHRLITLCRCQDLCRGDADNGNVFDLSLCRICMTATRTR